jgi:hypothetical protein
VTSGRMPRPCSAKSQVEQRRPTRHVVLPSDRVGGGRSALRIGPQLDHLRPHQESPRLGVVQRRGPACGSQERSATSSELKPRAAGTWS